MKSWIVILVLLTSLSARAEIDGDPLYASMTNAAGYSFYAWRPFYSSTVEGERWRKDWLWPLYTQKGFKDETYGRFLTLGFSSDFSPETHRHRAWLFPFFFKGTSAQDEDYLAIFPLGGKLYEFLGRDRVSFVLFPVYGTSQINEVKTTSVLWPILSRSKGDKIDRFRVWPFYGYSNLHGEFEKRFVLWPFYNSVEYTNERNPGGGFILFPFYGQVKTEQAHNYWVLPPFFRFVDSEPQRIINAPWPFVQIAEGDVSKRYFWPVYGKKEVGTKESQFALWPILWESKNECSGFNQYRRYAVPFFYYHSDVATEATEDYKVGDELSRYWKLWPLMSWERNTDGSRFRALELWPLRNTVGIERNWAPWWTFYKRTATHDETGHHFLWGLYRQVKSEEQFEWSLLKGIAGYKKTGDNRRYRALFMWFGDEEE
ncbi:MAG TPA: hypothetical protein VIR63_00260 [Pontiella sp.]